MWGSIGFVVVVMAINSHAPAPDQKSPLEERLGNIKSSLPAAEDYTKLLPQKTILENRILTQGSSVPLICGQALELDIQAYADGAPTGGTKKTTAHFGMSDVPPFIATALAKGVGVGSKQEFVFSEKQPLSSIFTGALLEAMVDKVEITVTKASPDMSVAFASDVLKIGLYDTKLVAGQGAACGDKVAVQLSLWDAAGKKIYSNTSANEKPIHLTIGGNKAMIGLEQSLIGMTVGTVRTVVLPPSWQASPALASPEIPAEIRKAQKHVVIAEITRVE
jgi:hypothetical protein